MKEFGGQAVIEGVMIAGKKNYVVAVRKGNRILVKRENINRVSDKYPILKWPFVRGIVSLVDTLRIGVDALGWSAMQAGEAEEELGKKDLVFVFASAFLFSMLLFVGVPFFLTRLVSKDDGLLFNLIDGFFRILVFVLYIWIISLFKDIQELFRYHGAEHKAVNCYEDGKKLTLENCRKYSTVHMRCGTSFLMIIVLISIVVFSLIADNRWYVKLVLRILLIPLIAGLAYELLKVSTRLKGRMNLLFWPGQYLQKLTTKEPNDKQLAVGIRALKEIIKLES
ncbi:MAG: DUF1385 domain-containing protein [Candidatus Woesearchaeota archaeon]